MCHAVTESVRVLCTPVAFFPSSNAEPFTVAVDSGRVPGARARGAPPGSECDLRARLRLPRLVLGLRSQGPDASQAARPTVPGRLPLVPRALHDRFQQGTAAEAVLGGPGGHLPGRGPPPP